MSLPDLIDKLGQLNPIEAICLSSFYTAFRKWQFILFYQIYQIISLTFHISCFWTFWTIFCFKHVFCSPNVSTFYAVTYFTITYETVKFVAVFRMNFNFFNFSYGVWIMLCAVDKVGPKSQNPSLIASKPLSCFISSEISRYLIEIRDSKFNKRHNLAPLLQTFLHL